ncbi:ABC-transporter metal-binding family protein [Serratia symbiotica]|nr:ABC-transporter metal-binding family protein [Serratia symbiotica]
MTLLYLLFDPFISFGFMRRALIACLALSLSTTPLGVFLLLRRMSLFGDALSHAILPGVAISYLIYGVSLISISIGGCIAGFLIAILSSFVSRHTLLKEDASFAGFYLGSLSFGVIIISMYGSNIDLLNILFGSILLIDSNTMLMVGIIVSFSLLISAILYRALVIESFDTTFLKVNSPKLLFLINGLFLFLVVINLVAGFQILGTLMSVGLMMVPAASARFWSCNLPNILIISIIFGMISSFIGLEWSYYSLLPAGPTIVLSASIIFFISILFGKYGSIYPYINFKKYFNK